jgi:hypothetical protein
MSEFTTEKFDYFKHIRPSAIPGRGILFANAYRMLKGHPDFIGKLTMEDGSIKTVCAYKNRGKDGQDFFTLTIRGE